MIAPHVNAAMRELGLSHPPLSEEHARAVMLDGLSTWSMRQMTDHKPASPGGVDLARGEVGLLYAQSAALQSHG